MPAKAPRELDTAGSSLLRRTLPSEGLLRMSVL